MMDVSKVRGESQEDWSLRSVAERCRLVAGVRHEIARDAMRLCDLVQSLQRTDPAQTLAAELVPMCEALKFLGRRGAKILRTRKLGSRDRPVWLWGVSSQVSRAPRGVVLIIGAWNYPLLLAGVQAAQALAAGNAVLWKPAPGCESATEAMAECFYRSGVPRDCLQVLHSKPESAIEAIEQGVDLVVLTGSAETGRKVLCQAAQRLTPAIMELSGCDSLIVLPGADLDRVAAAVRFGLTLNAGATCIGPRRLLVHEDLILPLGERLRSVFADADPQVLHPAAKPSFVRAVSGAIDAGCRDLLGHVDLTQMQTTSQTRPIVLASVDADQDVAQTDLFGPLASIISFDRPEQAVTISNDCPYALAANVFGPPDAASWVADRLRVGTVVINDLIAPTADPRVPFGGRRNSGFGVTRGVEGLLEMTVPKVIATRKSGPLIHLRPPAASDLDMLAMLLEIQHSAGWRHRLSGLRRLATVFKANANKKNMAATEAKQDSPLDV
jgi:aldehyde dehydrogenase (NAD+)